jgi:hypothetical protein
MVSPEQVQYLSQKLAGYYVLYQTCSDRLRPLGPTRATALYNDAYKKWQSDPSNPLFEPPRNDELKRAQYFAKCDEICSEEPSGMEEYVGSPTKLARTAEELMRFIRKLFQD